MATVTGPMLTTNVLSDQLALDFGDQIALLDPNENPFTLLMRMASKKRAVSYRYSHFEDRRKARFDTLDAGGGVTTTATSFDVDHGAYYQQWDLWQNTRTGEVFRVDGISNNTLTVTRNIAPSGVGTGVAMNDADELMVVGTAQPENDTSKPARSDVPTKIENFTQISRTKIELSDTLRASMFQLNPDEWGRQQKMKGIEHALDIESALLFGKKSDTQPGSAHARTTAGLFASMTSNQTDAGGDLSEAEFNAFMATVFTAGGGSATKLALASATGISALNKFPASKQMTQNNEKTYGMDVSTYTSPFGTIKTIFHKLLRGAKYGGYIAVVDMDNVSYRYLANDQMSRDTKLLTNRQANDQDGRADEFLTEFGGQFKLAETHGALTGITS